MSKVQVKRVYEEPSASDGYRVLIDRLWPHGVSKERAAVDLWLKEIAPSPDLRIWFNHEPAKFKEFSRRYVSELKSNPSLADLLKIIKQHKKITLLYAAKDPQVNHAVVLERFL
jgi:uncharacterized protein YeaO (DUF488 family)